jgi:hypothetical protein
VASALAGLDVALTVLDKTDRAVLALESVVARAFAVLAEAVVPASVRAANTLAGLSHPTGGAVALAVSAHAVAGAVAGAGNGVAGGSGPAGEALDVHAIVQYHAVFDVAGGAVAAHVSGGARALAVQAVAVAAALVRAGGLGTSNASPSLGTEAGAVVALSMSALDHAVHGTQFVGAVFAVPATVAHAVSLPVAGTVVAAVVLALVERAVGLGVHGFAHALAGGTVAFTLTISGAHLGLAGAHTLGAVQPPEAGTTVADAVHALSAAGAVVRAHLDRAVFAAPRVVTNALVVRADTVVAAVVVVRADHLLARLALPSLGTHARTVVAGTVLKADAWAHLDRAVETFPAWVTLALEVVADTVLGAVIWADLLRAIVAFKSITALARAFHAFTVHHTRAHLAVLSNRAGRSGAVNTHVVGLALACSLVAGSVICTTAVTRALGFGAVLSSPLGEAGALALGAGSLVAAVVRAGLLGTVLSGKTREAKARSVEALTVVGATALAHAHGAVKQTPSF